MAAGIAEVGRRFKMDEYFLPEVVMSAKCMHAALGILKPTIRYHLFVAREYLERPDTPPEDLDDHELIVYGEDVPAPWRT